MKLSPLKIIAVLSTFFLNLPISQAFEQSDIEYVANNASASSNVRFYFTNLLDDDYYQDSILSYFNSDMLVYCAQNDCQYQQVNDITVITVNCALSQCDTENLLASGILYSGFESKFELYAGTTSFLSQDLHNTLNIASPKKADVFIYCAGLRPCGPDFVVHNIAVVQ